jgi:peptidoglycan/LPS O-acetylase OafA/YrhL
MSMVLNTKYAGISVRKFYVSRALRLAPVYFIGIALMLLVSWREILGFFYNLSGISKAFFLTSNLITIGQDLPYVLCFPTATGDCAYPPAMTINPVSWSLAVEVGFYLLAPYIVTNPKKLQFYLFFG